MMTIRDQLDLEKRMVAEGISRYRRQIKSAGEAGREANTHYASALMQGFVLPIADAITAYCASKGPGVKAKYKPLLRQVNADTAAYLALRCLFNHFTKSGTLHQLAGAIGMMIEDEAKFSIFREKHKDYYETLIRDFERKGTKSYRHMHRVLTYKANEKNIGWTPWSLQDKTAVGVKVIDIIMQETDLIEKSNRHENGKAYIEIKPSASALDWVRRYNEYAELLNPDRLPCLIPPDDWISATDGGYYSPEMRVRTPLVKTRSAEQRELLTGDISSITHAINIIQRTPWRINKDVYTVMQTVWERALPIGLPSSEPLTVPPSPVRGIKKVDFTPENKERFEEWKAEARMIYTMERERVAKCFQAARVMRMAAAFQQYPQFYYVYQCDFRGRIYATVSGLSPQGPDFAKALIHFATGRPLTKDGARWLAVHGANCYGEDKVSYEDRIQWAKNNAEAITQTATDPMSMTSWWGEADKPWQFLAFCFEYARYLVEGDGMISHLPIGMDGSCNGLQNFSAMLRDSVGGAATNLVPQDVPSDIYAEVARVCTQAVMAQQGEYADLFKAYAKAQKNGVLPRSLAKRPVMTLPYGSTAQSCREYIYQFLVQDAPEAFPADLRFRLSVWLTPILWDSIGRVVVAARQAMGWLQMCAGKVAKTNTSIVWWTPMGFPVIQDRRAVVIHRVSTELAGRIQIKVGTHTGNMDVMKNRLAIAPNFVHSMDACHLMMTVTRAEEYGIDCFAFIHDDYGTHAADVSLLHQALREAFVDLYSQNDPLLDFKSFNEDHSGADLPDPPLPGTLNLREVLDSEYFFC